MKYFLKFVMFKLLILLLLCSLQTTLFAQSKWEQLEPTLKDSSERSKLNFYITAGKDLFVGNRKQAEVFANKAFAIAETKTLYLNEKADLYNYLGILAMYNQSYEKADDLFEKSLALSKQLNNEFVNLKAHVNIALNSSRKGDYQKAVLQNFAIIPLAEKKGDELMMANTYANLSNAYYYLSQLKASEIYQLKALSFFEKLDYKTGKANAWNTLASIYTDQKKWNKALTYYGKTAALKKELNDSLGLANTYINMAELYHLIDNSQATLSVLLKAENLYKALSDKEGLAKVYINMGVHYAKANDYNKAAEYEGRAIKLAEQGKDNYVLTTAYKNISKTYARLNNLDTALQFSKKALEAKDSLIDIELQSQIADMQIKYETAQKEGMIKEQQLQLKDKQYMLMRRNYIIAGALALLLFGLIGVLLVYRRKKLQHQVLLRDEVIRQQKLSTSAVLEAEEKERKRIAGDLHDGVGQMMSAAKMNLSAIEDELMFTSPQQRLLFGKIISLVDESLKEVRSVSHSMTPNALLKAGLASALRNFIEQVDKRKLKIQLHAEGLNDRLDHNIESMLYRVIQECVTNVIKHADATELDISLIKGSDAIEATIEDNGKGFNIETIGENDGIGFKNIRSRIAFLKGEIEWNSYPNKGTLVAFNVPL